MLRLLCSFMVNIWCKFVVLNDYKVELLVFLESIV